VSLNGAKLSDPAGTVLVESGQIVKVGKNRFARLLVPERA